MTDSKPDSASKSALQGRTTPPPPPTADVAVGTGTTIYYSAGLVDGEPQELEIVDAADLLPVLSSGTIVPDSGTDEPRKVSSVIAPRRAVPFRVPEPRARPSVVIDEGLDGPKSSAADIGAIVIPPPVESYVPSLTLPVIAKRVIVRGPPNPPAPKRSATVGFRSLGPASREEEGWVIGGETGLAISVKDPRPGRNRRLVAVYLAFKVTSSTPLGPDGLKVCGDLRWHGMPEDREADWFQKLTATKSGERLAQLMAALEYYFSHIDPRIGGVARLLGGPATNPEVAARLGYQYCAPRSPAVKAMIDMWSADAEARKAQWFYLANRGESFFGRWLSGIRRSYWRSHCLELETRFLLGKDQAESRTLPSQRPVSGLTHNQLSAVLGRVAEMAGQVVTSMGKVAWAGDKGIEEAMIRRDLPAVSATTYTVYDFGGE